VALKFKRQEQAKQALKQEQFKRSGQKKGGNEI